MNNKRLNMNKVCAVLVYLALLISLYIASYNLVITDMNITQQIYQEADKGIHTLREVGLRKNRMAIRFMMVTCNLTFLALVVLGVTTIRQTNIRQRKEADHE